MRIGVRNEFILSENERCCYQFIVAQLAKELYFRLVIRSSAHRMARRYGMNLY